MSSISVHELHQLLQDNPAAQVIDVRTPAEFAGVHVCAARNVPLDTLKPDALGARETPLYVLCRSGQRAAKAAEQLTREGFACAVVVEGGTQAWIDAGLPVSRGRSKVISLERQVRIAAGALVLTGVVLGGWVHPAFFGLSAFVGAGLVFAGITDWCGMGLLLAKAPWNQKA